MRSFEEMGTLASPRESPSPSRRPKRWARKCERYCCQTLTYFPLVFVYGLTSWAVWVEFKIGFLPDKSAWTGPHTSILGAILYILLNTSYTAAVFTDPGSPLNTERAGYSHLPSHEPAAQTYTSFTVKSTGELRYCKKCQTKKPDRAHHCSTCRRCVLKMDHHCPWLATCVGLRNYKMFMLFLIYTSLFCWVCFAVSATWVWREIISGTEFEESIMPVNNVLLSVLSGIVGLVLSGFTAWHIWLATRGQTTIESLEKTRYLSPMKAQMQQQLNERHYMGGEPGIGEQLREIHANALPGVTRPEEGEDRSSPAQSSLRQNYADLERAREYSRYRDYLDELDAQKLPNAFDLGWRKNLLHVFGLNPWLWFLPVANSVGDGWSWAPSPKWMEARERVAREREASDRLQKERERDAGWNINMDSPSRSSFQQDYRSPDRRDHGIRGSATSMRTMAPRSAGSGRLTPQRHVNLDEDDYDTSSDEHEADTQRRLNSRAQRRGDWNDIPEEFLQPPRRGGSKRTSSNKRGGSDDWAKWRPT